MALRAACGLITRRASMATAPTARRAFMSTAHEIFSEPSFPVRSNGFEGTDPLDWLAQYPKRDATEMWKVGSFPLDEATKALALEDALAATAEELWDTSGMLSALHESMPIRADTAGALRSVDELLQDAERGYYADSVLKKRRKKMNKHKHRKRKKAVRMRTKKN